MWCFVYLRLDILAPVCKPNWTMHSSSAPAAQCRPLQNVLAAQNAVKMWTCGGGHWKVNPFRARVSISHVNLWHGQCHRKPVEPKWQEKHHVVVWSIWPSPTFKSISLSLKHLLSFCSSVVTCWMTLVTPQLTRRVWTTRFDSRPLSSWLDSFLWLF